MEGEAIKLSIGRKLWGFELEGLSGMHYRTFAENIDEALKIAKAYATNLAKDPEGEHPEREVVSVWIEDNIDLVTEETVAKISDAKPEEKP